MPGLILRLTGFLTKIVCKNRLQKSLTKGLANRLRRSIIGTLQHRRLQFASVSNSEILTEILTNRNSKTFDADVRMMNRNPMSNGL